MRSLKLICIGASAGGVPALQKLLAHFNGRPKVPIVVIQHIAESSKIDLDLVFGKYFKGRLREAMDKDSLMEGTVYFAPSGYHLLVEKDLTLSLSQDEPVHFARPSIDVTMESAALSLPQGVCGVLLTGANSDGAFGLKTIQDSGGYTIVQDPVSAEVPAMPQAALDMMRPNQVAQVEDIAGHIEKLLGSVS